MTTALADPIAELGGLPFLDDSFVPGRLIALTLVLRHQQATHLGLPQATDGAASQAWLLPDNALELRPARPPVTMEPLKFEQERAVVDAVTVLAVAVPSWAVLLQLPVRFLTYPHPNAYSASMRSWPQHIFLAERAFCDADQIRSQVLHEFCHQWMYLIQEAWDLENCPDRDLTLPSGTSSRSIEEVLGGLHVAMALLRLYRTTGRHRERIERLTRYRDGCLDVIERHQTRLTDAGRAFAARLKEEQ